MPIHKNLNHDFFKTWSPEMAYVLGYFAADGSMIANKRGAHFIEFTSINKTLLVHVQRITGSNHRIAERPAHPNQSRTYRLQIGSKEWFRDLVRLGFTQSKSSTLRFPRVPQEYLSHFVRGYFDGDGCVHFSTYYPKDRPKGKKVFMCMFTSGSMVFLTKLKKVLNTQGLKGGSLYEKQRGKALSYSHRDSFALYQFMYDTRPVPAHLPRKRKVFEKAMRALGYTMRL